MAFRPHGHSSTKHHHDQHAKDVYVYSEASGGGGRSTTQPSYFGSASSSSTPSAARGSSTASGISANQTRIFDDLLRRPENRECFDCGAKQPRWASTNLGIFFCLKCAGIHRSMGTHISKVKSTNMDAWEPSMLSVMQRIGNTRGRQLYEYNMPASTRVSSTADPTTLERYIRSKYERKMYYHPRFAELFQKFLDTPIDAEEPAAKASPGRGNAPGATAIQPPPSRPPVPTAPPPPAIEELWGPPVSLPVASPAVPSTSRSQTDMAYLFSSSTASPTSAPTPFIVSPSTGAPAAPGPSGTGGWGQSSTGSTAGGAVQVLSQSPYAVSGGVAGAPLRVDAQSPIDLSSASSPRPSSETKGNVEDLFMGSTGHRTDSKHEIMSLFASVPVAGAGRWQNGSPSTPSATASPNGHQVW